MSVKREQHAAAAAAASSSSSSSTRPASSAASRALPSNSAAAWNVLNEEMADVTAAASSNDTTPGGSRDVKIPQPKILFNTTDNHLGYMEHDALRKDDSFCAFKEMLSIARANQVDFVLLGGDLFHENKPSRSTLCRTVNILREYTFGENPITFEITSDQKKNFPSTHTVNYEDPNFNVALPIFSIHGNHDDPSGTGSYSTMDLLHSCCLVNYFGKIDRVDHIVNYPILMKKGDTKLAIYGMGNVRDERLHRTFEMDGVIWDKPLDASTWFNLAVVHQNRTKHTVTQKDYLPEKFLPPWLDMVIWGHEHECCPDPVESVDGQYFVLQPGSSVATSLSGGESVEKKVFIMEIMGDQYRTVPIPLQTVRPFIIQEVKLSDDLDNSLDATPQQVEEYLTEKIQQLLSSVKKDPRYRNPDRPSLPLLRLRVDHTGFPRISNINKFGQKFVGKVANPEELLLFAQQKKVSSRGKGGAAGEGGMSKEEEEKQVDSFLRADRDKPPPIHDLVNLLIHQMKGGLNVLTEGKMAELVDEYVNKKDLESISNGVKKAIKTMAHSVREEKHIIDKDNIVAADVDRIIRKKHEEFAALERKQGGKVRDPEESKRLAELFDIRYDVDIPMREATLSEQEEDAAGAEEDSDAEEDGGGKKSRRKPAAAASAGRGRGRGRGRGGATGARGGRGGGCGKKKQQESDEESRMEEDEEMKEEIEDSEDGEWGVRSSKSSSKSRRSSKKKFAVGDSDAEQEEEDEEDRASRIADEYDEDEDAKMNGGGHREEGDEDESSRPVKKQRKQAPPKKEKIEKTAAAAVAAKPSPNTKKRGRAAAGGFDFFAVARQRGAAAASSASGAAVIDLIDDTPARRPAASAAAPAGGRAAAIDVEMDGVEIEEMKGWGSVPNRKPTRK